MVGKWGVGENYEIGRVGGKVVAYLTALSMSASCRMWERFMLARNPTVRRNAPYVSRLRLLACVVLYFLQ